MEYIKEYIKENKDRFINELIDLLNIYQILDKYPHEISAGEAQRAALARSLITQPDLLLLDEPLSNVDQSFKEEIQEKLKKILKNSNCLLYTSPSPRDRQKSRMPSSA